MVKSIEIADKLILIDSEDYHIIDSYKKWYLVNGKYMSTSKGGKTLYLHRLIMEAKTKEQVDHINNDTLDYRRCNLRIATQTQNAQNKKKYASKFKFKGINIVSIGNGKYKYIRARIIVNKKSIHLGLFKTYEEAALRYNEAAIKYFGEFANLNKV